MNVSTPNVFPGVVSILYALRVLALVRRPHTDICPLGSITEEWGSFSVGSIPARLVTGAMPVSAGFIGVRLASELIRQPDTETTSRWFDTLDKPSGRIHVHMVWKTARGDRGPDLSQDSRCRHGIGPDLAGNSINHVRQTDSLLPAEACY